VLLVLVGKPAELQGAYMKEASVRAVLYHCCNRARAKLALSHLGRAAAGAQGRVMLVQVRAKQVETCMVAHEHHSN
jgi:hypothetical protein